MADPATASLALGPPPRRRRWPRRLLLAALAMGLLVAFADQAVTWRWGDRVADTTEALRPAPVALVLGTAKYFQGRENLFYRYRIDAAAELYAAGLVRGLIVSGDNGRHGYDEPSQMRADLIAAGVPAAHITCDYAGFRTFDSIVRAKEVFGQRHLIVISQRFHCERALLIAQAHGIRAEGYAAADVPRRWQMRIRAREALARLAAWGDCYLWQAEPRFLGPPEAVGMARAGSL